jgi:hypothetical protein
MTHYFFFVISSFDQSFYFAEALSQRPTTAVTGFFPPHLRRRGRFSSVTTAANGRTILRTARLTRWVFSVS